jgi:hypothetical protein
MRILKGVTKTEINVAARKSLTISKRKKQDQKPVIITKT